jgi:hypothetical protein
MESEARQLSESVMWHLCCNHYHDDHAGGLARSPLYAHEDRLPSYRSRDAGAGDAPAKVARITPFSGYTGVELGIEVVRLAQFVTIKDAGDFLTTKANDGGAYEELKRR